MFNIDIQMIKETLNMFAFLAVELTILFLLISYIVGVIQEYVPPQKIQSIQSILSSKNGKGYIVAGFGMALIIVSAGAGLTEVILLKSIFKNNLIIAFLVVILSMAIISGYVYSYIF
jgi:uncharacterized membrane protein YraQ (UPF0718 family)